METSTESTSWKRRILWVVAGTLCSAVPARGQDKPLECNWNLQCEEKYMEGSVCLDDGTCMNPYASGCLNSFISRYGKWDDRNSPEKRICNSNDDPDSELCDPSRFDYPEIRIHQANWESSMFYAWILQIFLSEFLQVPATVGLTRADTPLGSFYNINNAFAYSSSAYIFEDLLLANEMGGDCLATDRPCAHVMPEVWIGQEKRWQKFLSEDHIDQVTGDGQVGKISWYIPVATAQKFPAVTSFHGMQGEREMLADIFKRPTTWAEYCSEVSATGCSEPDGVASRAPIIEGEDMAYFKDGAFTGHFRMTDANNCTANPGNCTGHIVGSPCTWSTNIEAQLFHNNIPLESNGYLPENQGYSYGQMIQIWRAANATKSDVIMWWWTPEATTEEFRGSDYEFQPVLLPEPTNACREARIEPEDRCSLDPKLRQGFDPIGSCDNEANSLQTVVASSLRDLTFETPEVDRSPGYQGILNLKVSHLAMNAMLKKWVEGGRTGFSARQAVCDWVVDNQAQLEAYIPRGYPREFQMVSTYDSTLNNVALGVAAFAVVYITMITVLVYWFSDTKVFVYAQVPFVFMVLGGLFMIACGAILYALEPKDAVCTSQIWLVNIGYTLELVPLLVKVAAINRVMEASKKLKRIRIRLESMFIAVAVLILMVVAFLTLWTIMDGPERTEGRYLTDNTEIVTTVSCDSESSLWSVVVLCWNGLLIVCATVLAFQSRNIKEEFNDSRSLGTMIYSQFVFGVLRAITFNLGSGSGETNTPSISPSDVAAASSLLLGIDAVTAVTIYFVPKLAAARKSPTAHDNSSDPSRYTYTNVSGLHPSQIYSQNLQSQISHGLTGNISAANSSVVSEKLTRGSSNLMMMPSINEEKEENASFPSSRSSQSTRSSGRRISMDGKPEICQGNRSSSELDDSDRIDEGGPRFSQHSGELRRVSFDPDDYSSSLSISSSQPSSSFIRRSFDEERVAMRSSQYSSNSSGPYRRLTEEDIGTGAIIEEEDENDSGMNMGELLGDDEEVAHSDSSGQAGTESPTDSE